MAESNFSIGVNDNEVVQRLQKVIDAVTQMGVVSKQTGKDLKNSLGSLKDITSIEKAYNAIGVAMERNEAAMQELIDRRRQYLNLLSQNKEDMTFDQQKKIEDHIHQIERLIGFRKELNQALINTSDAVDSEAIKVEAAGEKQKNFRTELSETTNEYRRMIQEIQNGKAIDPVKLDEVKKKYLEMRGAMQKMNIEMSILTSKNPALTAMATAVQGVTGAFSVAQGVMGLFNQKSEDMQKIMMRVQSLMAVMMGLQQVQNTLLAKDAILTSTVGKLKQWWAGVTAKAAVAQQAQNTASAAGTVANKGLAASFRLVGVAIKSIPGVGWLIAGVTSLIGVIRSLTKESREAKRMQEELYKGVASEAAKPIAKIRELSSEFRSLQNQAQIEDFLKRRQKDFEDLGVAIDSARDAERLLIDNTDAWVKAEIEKAKATVARRMLEKSMEDEINARAKKEDNIANYQNAMRNGNVLTGAYYLTKAGYANKELRRAEAEEQRLVKVIEEATKSTEAAMRNALGGIAEVVKTPSEEIERINKKLDGSISALKQKKSELQKLYDSATNDSRREKYKKEIEQTQKEIDALEGKRESINKNYADLNANERVSEFQHQLNIIKQLREYYTQLYELTGDEYGALRSAQELYGDALKNLPEGLDLATVATGNYVEVLEAYRKEMEAIGGDKAKQGVESINDAIRAFKTEEAIDAARKAKESAETTRRENEERLMSEAQFLIAYGDLQEKKLGVTKKYAQLIANAKNEWEKKSLEKQRDTELFNLERSAKGSLEKIFRDVSKQSKGTLNEMLKDANKLLNEMKARGDDNVEGFKALQEQINAIQDSLDKMDELDWGWGIDQLVTGLSKVVALRKKESELRQKAKEAEKNGNTAEAEGLNKRADNLQENSKRIGENIKKNWVAFGVNTFVSGLQRAAELAQQIAEITSNESLANWAEEAGALAQNFQAASQGAASGGWIGAIVGGVSDMINQTISSVMEAKAWVAQYKASIREFRDAIELADIVFDPHRFSDMFGNRSLESAVDAYRAINDLSAKNTEQVTAAFELGERQKKNASKGVGILGGILSFGGAGIEPWFGFKKKTTQKWYSELDAYERGMNKLQAIQVRVKRASGWAKLWGGQDKYKSLFDVAPELWGGDINGEFDVERAKKFLETSKQLTDEQRRQIEQAIKYKEELDKAKDALEQVIGDTVGSFADDMADSVWEAITKGADAWEVFRNKGNEALVALGKQMLKEFAISTYLEAFKDKLKEAYGSGDTNALAEIYTEIFNGMPAVLENMTIAGQQWVDMLKANGYDITQEGATSGTKGGYATQMSHEDASEINGRMTDIQMQIRLMQGNVVQLVAIQQETRGFARMQTDYLYDIRRYTALLPSIADYSKKIAANTANL